MWAASCPTLAAGQPRQHNSTQPGTLMCPLALVSSRAGQRSSQAQQKHALLSVTPGLQVHVHWHSVCTAPACAAGCGCRLALDIYTAQRPHRHVCLKGGCASTLHHTWRPQLTVCALIVTRAQASGTLRAAAPAAQQPLEALRQGARRCCFCVLVGHHRVVVAGRLALPTLGGALREWGVRGKPDRQFCVLCVRERCTLASRHKQQQARPQHLPHKLRDCQATIGSCCLTVLYPAGPAAPQRPPLPPQCASCPCRPPRGTAGARARSAGSGAPAPSPCACTMGQTRGEQAYQSPADAVSMGPLAPQRAHCCRVDACCHPPNAPPANRIKLQRMRLPSPFGVQSRRFSLYEHLDGLGAHERHHVGYKGPGVHLVRGQVKEVLPPAKGVDQARLELEVCGRGGRPHQAGVMAFNVAAQWRGPRATCCFIKGTHRPQSGCDRASVADAHHSVPPSEYYSPATLTGVSHHFLRLSAGQGLPSASVSAGWSSLGGAAGTWGAWCLRACVAERVPGPGQGTGVGQCAGARVLAVHVARAGPPSLVTSPPGPAVLRDVVQVLGLLPRPRHVHQLRASGGAQNVLAMWGAATWPGAPPNARCFGAQQGYLPGRLPAKGSESMASRSGHPPGTSS